ncbi:unnamed protein product [Nippostrongylus brasiliensis]|uniref:Secreted protein n=1 Tax=Nippostrongylus brasiliensis TaxID=27835 RepID=A0A0N4XY88_NIPBR|nr:unnamed protein product [Nippostrongylus brasiliensis]
MITCVFRRKTAGSGTNVHDRLRAIESDHCTTNFVARDHHGMDCETNSHAEENDNGSDSDDDGFDIHDDLYRECCVWICFVMCSQRRNSQQALPALTKFRRTTIGTSSLKRAEACDVELQKQH